MSSIRLGKLKDFFKGILGKYVLEKPFAATAEDWDIWNKTNKKKYPIRYFIQEDLPIHIYRLNDKLFRDPYWWFNHNFVKKHQYNIIRIRDLKAGYYDPDVKILHAVMQEVCDFWENRLELYSDDDSNYDDWELQIRKVYEYWTVKRKELKNQMEDAVPDELREEMHKNYPLASIVNPKYHNDPTMQKYKRCLDKRSRIEDKIDRQDKTNLIIVMRYLNYLWC